MRLIFNRDDNGSREIKEVLGFADADFKFANMRMDFRAATRLTISFIGQEVYDAVADYYWLEIIEPVDDPVLDPLIDPVIDPPVEDPSVDDPPVEDPPIDVVVDPHKPLPQEVDMEDLLLELQYAIAIRAMSQHVLKTDLAKTTNGRKMRADDQEKTPWDWMLDRDNEQMQRDYYKAVAVVIELIEFYEVWLDSEKRATLHSSIMTSLDDIKTHYHQATQFLFYQLVPGFKLIQEREIATRVDAATMTQLLGIPDPKFGRLKMISKQVCCLGAMIWGLKSLRISIFPEGVMQSFTSDRNSTQVKGLIDPGAVNQTIYHFKTELDRSIKELETELRILFPKPDEASKTKAQPKGYIENDKFFSL
jgi:hypothetical protein